MSNNIQSKSVKNLNLQQIKTGQDDPITLTPFADEITHDDGSRMISDTGATRKMSEMGAATEEGVQNVDPSKYIEDSHKDLADKYTIQPEAAVSEKHVLASNQMPVMNSLEMSHS